MKKFLVFGLIFTNWSTKNLIAYPNYQPPTYNSMASGLPNSSMSSTSKTPGTQNNSSKPAPAPAWLKTDPWFGDSTNTVKLDPSLGDSSWTVIFGSGSGSPDASTSPFTAPNEDIAAGPQN